MLGDFRHDSTQSAVVLFDLDGVLVFPPRDHRAPQRATCRVRRADEVADGTSSGHPTHDAIAQGRQNTRSGVIPQLLGHEHAGVGVTVLDAGHISV